MEAADLAEHEKVLVVDNTNGARLETYAITGQRGSGEICINGAAARLVSIDDKVIILAYSVVSDEEAREIKPRLIKVDERNAMVKEGALIS